MILHRLTELNIISGTCKANMYFISGYLIDCMRLGKIYTLTGILRKIPLIGKIYPKAASYMKHLCLQNISTYYAHNSSLGNLNGI
jgi:uncharacterized membrane protein